MQTRLEDPRASPKIRFKPIVGRRGRQASIPPLGDAFRAVTSIVNVVNTFRMLDIGLAESRNALILAGRIEDCFVQREWLSDPLRESGVVSDIILRERVDKNG